MTYVAAALLGVLAGGLAGMFGVGGGILFVPTLVALGLTQVHAEATSLLAMIPVVLLGVWRHRHYGNVRWRPSLTIGVASIGAAVGGAALAISLPESVLRRLFAVLLLLTAAQLAWRARRADLISRLGGDGVESRGESSVRTGPRGKRRFPRAEGRASRPSRSRPDR